MLRDVVQVSHDARELLVSGPSKLVICCSSLARGMMSPTTMDLEELKRLGRCLRRRQRTHEEKQWSRY